MSVPTPNNPGQQHPAPAVPTPSAPVPAAPSPVRGKPSAASQSSGLVVPQTPILAKQTYASPLSFVGSTRRIVAKVKKVSAAGPAIAFLAWTGAVLALILTWTFVLVWTLIVFYLFGFLTFPYRLVRRSQRKQAQVQRAQLATMQAMMINQQRALNQNEQRDQ